ncbi:MAG: hypothetical protein ACI4TJ_05000 [Candidatus Cryptobacteroides sp.]
MKHRLILMIICAAALASCGQRRGGSEVENTPEAVVEAFNRAVTAGDFARAWTLVDSLGMKDYLDSYQEAWDTLMEQDSTALAIAERLLSGAVIEFRRTEKDGPQRHVYYRLEADGRSKERLAVVRKEEGEWKIVSVTNAN